ncbi:UrcA family protein [Caulobacter sp. NIBR2454]|uniref:UrcA family protein n=1 Tax=Caulobacter sp. NIBR2454 TaxID=3015996 RepID=UPI0022B6C6EF|nr:UrcA family protein [Caulobacter sp. NIBR2454]
MSKQPATRRSTALRSSTLAACALVLLGSGTALAAGDARVRIGDLDLSHSGDRDTLRQRSEAAAEQFCAGESPRSPLNVRERCRRAVLEEVAQAVAVARQDRARRIDQARPVAMRIGR